MKRDGPLNGPVVKGFKTDLTYLISFYVAIL